MKYLLDKDKTVVEDFARFGKEVLGIKEQDDQEAMAYQAIEALQTFIKEELGLPEFLSEVNVDNRYFVDMAKKACRHQDSLPKAYRPLTQEDCINIYQMCL